MGNRTHGQWDMGKGVSWLILKIEMGYLGGWGTWVVEHMGNGAHGHMITTSLILHESLQKFYWT